MPSIKGIYTRLGGEQGRRARSSALSALTTSFRALSASLPPVCPFSRSPPHPLGPSTPFAATSSRSFSLSPVPSAFSPPPFLAWCLSEFFSLLLLLLLLFPLTRPAVPLLLPSRTRLLASASSSSTTRGEATLLFLSLSLSFSLSSSRSRAPSSSSHPARFCSFSLPSLSLSFSLLYLARARFLSLCERQVPIYYLSLPYTVRFVFTCLRFFAAVIRGVIERPRKNKTPRTRTEQRYALRYRMRRSFVRSFVRPPYTRRRNI